MIKIAHASINENGAVNNGRPGNQNGMELSLRDWYNRPWNKVLRCTDDFKTALLCKYMLQAVRNQNIGYCQQHRTTLWAEAEKKDFRLDEITTPCECDCSSLIAVVCMAAGIKIDKNVYTGNIAQALLNTGYFELLDDESYLVSDKQLMPGDILLYEFHHVAMAMQYGQKKNYRKGWNYGLGGWWYCWTSMAYYHDCWKVIKNHKYYFDSNGFAVRDWQLIDSKWYYFEPRTWHDFECACYKTDEFGSQDVGFFKE